MEDFLAIDNSNKYKFLIFIRHGETIENNKGLIQGWLPGQLTLKGQEQIKNTTQRLTRFLPITNIFSSPLSRTMDSTAIICNCMNINALPIFCDDLKERGFGPYEGKSLFALKRALVTKADSSNSPDLPGIEPYSDFMCRIDSFCHTLFNNHYDGNSLIITHKGVLSVIWQKFMNSPPPLFDNGEGFVITLTNEAPPNHLKYEGPIL